MRQGITGVVVTVALMLTACSWSAAATPPSDEVGRYIGVTYSFDYHTIWLSKGALGYGKQGAAFNTVNLDFFQTGFGAKVTHRNAAHDGYVDKQRFDYIPYYKGKAFVGEWHQIDFDVSVGYEHYYGRARHKANTTWESVFAFKFPGLSVFGAVPRYIVHYETPVSGGDANRKVAGWIHRFGFDLPIKNEVLPLKLSSEVAYYGGLGNTTHDWAYANVGLSSSFPVCPNVTFVPGIYQQISFDDAVNSNKDITYGIFSVVVRMK